MALQGQTQEQKGAFVYPHIPAGMAPTAVGISGASMLWSCCFPSHPMGKPNRDMTRARSSLGWVEPIGCEDQVIRQEKMVSSCTKGDLGSVSGKIYSPRGLCSRMWFNGRLVSARLAVVLSDLRGLFQPQCIYDPGSYSH